MMGPMRTHIHRSLTEDRRKSRLTFDSSDDTAARKAERLRDRRLALHTERVGSSIILIISFD